MPILKHIFILTQVFILGNRDWKIRTKRWRQVTANTTFHPDVDLGPFSCSPVSTVAVCKFPSPPVERIQQTNFISWTKHHPKESLEKTKTGRSILHIFVTAEQADTLLGKLEELTTKISSLAGTAESWTRQDAVLPLFMPITNWLLLWKYMRFFPCPGPWPEGKKKFKLKCGSNFRLDSMQVDFTTDPDNYKSIGKSKRDQGLRTSFLNRQWITSLEKQE